MDTNETFTFKAYAKVNQTFELPPHLLMGLDPNSKWVRIIFPSGGVYNQGERHLVVPYHLINEGEPRLEVPQAFLIGSGAVFTLEAVDLGELCSRTSQPSETGGWYEIPPELADDPTLVHITNYLLRDPIPPTETADSPTLGQITIVGINYFSRKRANASLRLMRSSDEPDPLHRLISMRNSGRFAYRVVGVAGHPVYYTQPFASDVIGI